MLLGSVNQDDLDSLKSRNYDFSDDFLGPNDTHSTAEVLDLSRSVEGPAAVVPRKRLQIDAPTPSTCKKKKTFHFENSSKSVSASQTRQESGNTTWNCLICTL